MIAWSRYFVWNECVLRRLCMISSRRRRIGLGWKLWTSSRVNWRKQSHMMLTQSNVTENLILGSSPCLSSTQRTSCRGTEKSWHSKITWRNETRSTLLRWTNLLKVRRLWKPSWILTLTKYLALNSSCICSSSFRVLNQVRSAMIRGRV